MAARAEANGTGVIQASFAAGAQRRLARAEPPAPAASLQPGRAAGGPPRPGGQRPPHPATVGRAGVSGTAQRATGQRPPHPATVGRAGVSGTAQRATGQRPPHPATVGRAGAAGTAQPRGAGEAFAAPPGFLRHAAWRRGEPLPASIQRAVEQRLGGVDLSTVRTHEGPEAASIGALAFTRGEDIYFAQGQYRPETRSGRELLGRQIAYVLQQRQGRVHNPLGAGVAVVIDPVLDAEARAFSAVT